MTTEGLLYIDAVNGLSGDMFLGALCDLGYPVEKYEACIRDLGLTDVQITLQKVMRQAVSAGYIQVHDRQAERQFRSLDQIEKLVRASKLSPQIQERGLKIFHRIAEAEASVHGTGIQDVHFHELGAVDTLVDVFCTLQALHDLNIHRVICSPLPMGRGMIRSDHGLIPLPAPATISLLKGAELRPSSQNAELVTPTGAALAAGLAEAFGDIPRMVLRKSGYGAGSRNGDIPNVIRLLLGDAVRSESESSLWMIECNIDDMNPEFYDHIMDQLFTAGALDVFMVPIHMKKNRPAVLLSVLSPPVQKNMLMDIILKETTTGGLRYYRVDRRILDRSFETVNTVYGQLRIKIFSEGGRVLRRVPEYDDCAALAAETDAAIQDVYNEALRAAQETGMRHDD